MDFTGAGARDALTSKKRQKINTQSFNLFVCLFVDQDILYFAIGDDHALCESMLRLNPLSNLI